MACIWRLGEKNISGLGGVLHGISTPNHCMVSPWYLHLSLYIYILVIAFGWWNVCSTILEALHILWASKICLVSCLNWRDIGETDLFDSQGTGK